MDDKQHLYQKAGAHETRVQKACAWTTKNTCTKKQVPMKHVYEKACAWTTKSTCTKQQVPMKQVYEKHVHG